MLLLGSPTAQLGRGALAAVTIGLIIRLIHLPKRCPGRGFFFNRALVRERDNFTAVTRLRAPSIVIGHMSFLKLVSIVLIRYR